MAQRSAWVTVALGAWLAAACGSRSGLAVGERLGEADSEGVGLAGAANGGGAAPGHMDGVGEMPGFGGVDPARPGGMIMPDPPVITPPLPMQTVPEWFPRGVLPLRADELRRSAQALLGVEIRTEQRADFEQEYLIENASASGRNDLAVGDSWLDEVLSQVTDEQLQVAVGCGADIACSLEAFLSFATRAWRKPLSAEEQARVTEAFATAQGAGGELWRFVRAILGDPSFALLSLLGEPVGDSYQLTDFELAAQLSFQLTGAPPDAELWEMAEAGLLRDHDSRVKQASRLLSDAAAQKYVGERVAHWFEAVAYEDTEHPLGAETLNGETQRFIHHVLFEAQLPPQRLLDADYTFVNQELAEWYGLLDLEEGWRRLSLANTTRRGILHHASWLGQGPPVKSQHFRGGEYHEWRGMLPAKLICSSIPLPPDGGGPLEPESLKGTPREQMEALTADPACASCHNLFDPVAFSFDHYDGRGQYRATFSTGEPIDASGEVSWLDGELYEFDDSADFVTQLAASDKYLDCFQRLWVDGSIGVRPSDPGVRSYSLQHSKRAERFVDLTLEFVSSEHYVNRR